MDKTQLLNLLIAKGKEVSYTMKELGPGMWELITKKPQTKNLNSEAVNFLFQQQQEKKAFHDIFHHDNNKDIFFVDTAQNSQTNEIVLCLLDKPASQRLASAHYDMVTFYGE